MGMISLFDTMCVCINVNQIVIYYYKKNIDSSLNSKHKAHTKIEIEDSSNAS